MYKIFLLEDDYNFGQVLQSYLEINDYEVVLVTDGVHAFDEYKKNNFDICILDVMLPNVDGFTIAQKIKGIHPFIPLIFLTAKTLKSDILEGFKIGADDYITKPFDSEVLLYKIKAIIKRNIPNEIFDRNKLTYKIGEFIFNYEKRTLNIADHEQKLSPKETELLFLMCKSGDQVMSRKDALIKIWGDNNYFTTRSMDVYITKLRKYLKKDPHMKIENIHGAGFILHQTDSSDNNS